MKMTYTLSPKSEDINFLTQKINEETIDKGEAFPFAFFIHDNQKEIIAGCNGSIIYGSIYTDQIWVHPAYRKTGLGRELMKQVHSLGRTRSCSMATIATMSFQKAKEFYEHLGYECDFERPGYVGGSSCLYLRKTL